MSLEALVLCAGRFQLPLPTLASSSDLGLLEAKGSCRQEVGLQAISSTLRSVYAWDADVCYPLVHASGNLATLWLRKSLEMAVFNSDTREFRPNAYTCFSHNLSQPLREGG